MTQPSGSDQNPPSPPAAAEPPSPDALLCSLAAALVDGRTLAWAVEHASGSDPLPGAWAACASDLTMAGLLERLGRDEHRAVWAQLALGHSCTSPPHGANGCPRCADAIRARVPTLTLKAVLATAARRA